MGRLRNKRGRKSNYRKQLQQDDNWQNVRVTVKLRDKHKCICCSSPLYLEVHHITYYVNGESIVGKELEFIEWMATVCEDCHVEIHKDEFHQLNPKNKNKVNVHQFKTSK
ncbi:HNH endonuclease [Flavicella sediminum]|uniref:HNH endonuclease n=1 Tax=Flavicella sediminum TaxID=2585141 RepID=UPI001AA0793A|nr:HNH endonuclease [Flavicella sediminum]